MKPAEENNPEMTNIANSLLDPDKLKEQEKHIQVISSELMEALKNTAQKNEHPMEIEVVNRLIATITKPNAFGFNPVLDKISHRMLESKQVKIEKEMNQRAWDVLFELQKLELFLKLKGKISKKYKETFFIINVKKETKRIEAALAEERRKEK